METLSPRSTIDLQADLVRRYCGDVEAMIRDATTMEEAERIGEKLCNRLEEECNSELVVNATRTYVQEVIHRKWRRR